MAERLRNVNALLPTPKIQLDAATLGPVTPHEHGGWPEFTVTLTYHVETDDPAVGTEAARAFFHAVGMEGPDDWPYDNAGGTDAE